MTTWLRGIFQRTEQPSAKTAYGGEHQEPVVVYTAANRMEADLVIALLASEGIPAFASSESLGQVYGLQVGPLAFVDVVVAAAMAESATIVIEQRYAFQDDAEVDAGEDGERLDGDDDAYEDESGGFSSNS